MVELLHRGGEAEELHAGDNGTVCVAADADGANQELEYALRLRLLGGRRRIVGNLLPMPEPVLQDLNAVQLDVHEWSLECRGVDADRRSAASLLQRRTPVFRGTGVRLRLLRTIGTALNAGSWIRIEVRAGATSPG
jgi:hypothetical protein